MVWQRCSTSRSQIVMFVMPDIEELREGAVRKTLLRSGGDYERSDEGECILPSACG